MKRLVAIGVAGGRMVEPLGGLIRQIDVNNLSLLSLRLSSSSGTNSQQSLERNFVFKHLPPFLFSTKLGRVRFDYVYILAIV